jgi:hypothetical protein
MPHLALIPMQAVDHPVRKYEAPPERGFGAKGL